MYYYVYSTAVGKMTIAEENSAIVMVSFGASAPPKAEKSETELIKRTFMELEEYFAGKRREFDIPLAPKGTAFQLKVWEALKTIPYSETRTYQQIAEQTGNIKASRAVGMANNKNPIAIIVPCHRVIGANGSLVGYAAGLKIKEKLLEIEKGAVN